MGENHQKIKLLQLMELLREETDEDHPMTTKQICARLSGMGISCDRRTLSKDIDLFEQFGYEVMSTRIGHEKAYYIADRRFSVPELKILIDAVQAASFVTRRKTDELIDKLANLGGSHRAEILKSNVVGFNTRKHSNESVYYSVGFLGEALAEKKKASFYYFDLDERGKRIYRKDYQRYIVEPIALIFHEDNYYLMCYNSKYEGETVYRVDRMDQPHLEDAPITPEALEAQRRTDLGSYTGQVFKMFGGASADITIELENDLIGAVYDKFGEDTGMIRTGPNRLVAQVSVQLSAPFYGWLTQFGGRMRVLMPQSVIDAYHAHLDAARCGGSPESK